MPRDPSTRAYRTATLGAFIAFAAVYISLVVHGVVLSLRHQGALASAASTAGCASSPPACASSLGDLRHELDAKAMAVRANGTQAERLWEEWRVDWERRLQGVRASCCLDEGHTPEDRAPLARTAVDLEKLARLYAIESVRFAREVGPEVERFDADLAVVSPHPSEDPGPQRLPASP